MVYTQNDQIQSNVPSAWYSSLENFIVKGKNAEIWDSEGNRYLDYVRICSFKHWPSTSKSC